MRITVSGVLRVQLFRLMVNRLAMVAVVALALSASAADYHWTGAAGNGLWSDSGNWESASGAAVAAPVAGTAYTYNFGTRNGKNVGWGGDTTVVQDIDVNISIIALNPAATDSGETLTIARSGNAKLKFPTTDGATIYVQSGSRLVLKGDMSSDSGNSDITKYGTGTLVFDLVAANASRRVLYIQNGSVELAESGAAPNLAIVGNFSASEASTPTIFNYQDGAEIQAINVSDTTKEKANARLYLGGNDLALGGETASSTLMNITMPVFADGATLTLRNGRQASTRGLPLSGTLQLGRADATVGTPGTVIRYLFDDPSDPLRDDIGTGSRLLAPKGTPDIVQDPERGSVLSISGGKYLKGPDADAGLAELQPQASHNAYTVAFWFKPDSKCDSVGKIFFWGTDKGGQAAALRLNNSATQPLMFTPWGNNRSLTAPNVRDGKWHHFAATFNGNAAVNVYVDGVNVDSFSQTGYAPLNRNFYVGSVYGGWVTNGANPYTGLLDDFLLASYELRAEDVAQIYEDGLASLVGVGSFASENAGVGTFTTAAATVSTLSGSALAGGLALDNADSTLTVGVEAGATATEFKGHISGSGATLVKEGADYALALSGEAPAVSTLNVKSGTFETRRPTATPGLVVHYSFTDEETLGRDSSPTGLPLTKTGTGTLSAVDDGVSGSALHFGGSAYLSSANYIRPEAFPSGNDSFTASAWIRPTAEACAGTWPVFAWGDPAVHKLVMLRFSGANSVVFSNWSADVEASGLALSDGKWHHVAITYDGDSGVKKIFYDGEEVATQTVAGGIDVGVSNPLMLGHCSVGSRASQYYTGDMDEFRLLSYAQSAEEIAAEYALKAPPSVAAATRIPEPVARYTFDGDDPCADATGKYPLSMQNGTVATVSGDAISGKAAKFAAGSAYFTLPTYPSEFPSGDKPFTVVVRYRPDSTQATSYAPSVMILGDANGWNSGKVLKISTGNAASSGGKTLTAFRSVVGGNIPVIEGLYYGSAMATERSQWIVAAVVVAPQPNGSADAVARVYIDGVQHRNYVNVINDITPQGFAIGSNPAGTQTFYGLVDEVQVYDCALSDGQVRLVAEALDASKGTDGSAYPEIAASVLAATPAVSVAEGATLRIVSSERIASLSGTGTIEIAAGARLEVGAINGFTGSFVGTGTLAIADGATIDFGDASAPLADFGGSVALGSGVALQLSVDDTEKHLLFGASDIVGTDNLSTWTLSGSTSAVLSLSRDGKSLYAGIQAGFVLIVR